MEKIITVIVFLILYIVELIFAGIIFGSFLFVLSIISYMNFCNDENKRKKQLK